jgi:hypothetical protein
VKTGYFILLVLIFAVIPACEDEGTCSENVVSRVNAGFYTLAGGTEAKATVNQYSMYGSTRPDSVILKSNVSNIEFPLSMHETSSVYIMTADTLTDTLEVQYSNKLALISWECGFTNQFEILSVIFTRNYIDSIAIVKSIADPGDEENLKIFI